MPNTETHNLLDHLFFGCQLGAYDFVHEILDHGGEKFGIDFQKIFGVTHRHYMHDERAIIWIFQHYGWQASQVARLHIALDKISTRDRRNRSKGGL